MELSRKSYCIGPLPENLQRSSIAGTTLSSSLRSLFIALVIYDIVN